MMMNPVFAIGLMSGTSLDGVDLVYVQFDSEAYQQFSIIAAKTYAYSDIWKDQLQEAIHFTSSKLEHLNLEYGGYLADLIRQFKDEFGIKHVDFIASHGHTVLHQPDQGITLQIGDGHVIAKQTGIKTVCDFRSQDVALGGQGAPLVPIGDALLFSNYEACLNLGGFSNISYQKENQREAYDICPVNIVLNHYTQKIGLAFDDGGQLAKSGTFSVDLYEKLNQLAFYKTTAPKSLGLEWVQEHVFPIINTAKLDIPSILHTFTKHAAYQLGKNIKGFQTVLVTGGGAWNKFLMESMEREAGIPIPSVSQELIDYKEALVFAFLGLLRLKNENNCLQSVTGASRDHSSGVIFTP